MSQYKIENKGLVWELGLMSPEYNAKYKDISLEVLRVQENGSTRWYGSVENGENWHETLTPYYKTRKKAMEGTQVIARFIKKESVLSISENMDIKPKEVEKHIRRWL